MGLSKDQLMAGVGFSAGQASALEDQLTKIGNATPPSAGGSSLNTEGNIFTFFGQVGNGADTTEDLLKSFNLPANALDSVGRSINIYAWGSYGANTNSKTVKMYFGASTVTSTQTLNGGGWALEMMVGKSASNVQRISGQIIAGTSHGGCTTGTGAETDTAAITIKVTGQDTTSANANAVVLQGLVVNYMN